MTSERRAYDAPDRPGTRLDVQIDSPAREGLTGTTPADAYAPVHDPETITIAPDWRPMEQQPAWRTDFPIDAPQEHYVERRDFLKFMVLTSLAFTVGQFWIALQNWLRRRRGEPQMARVANLDELPVGTALTFAYPGPTDHCLMVRLRDDAIVAYGQKCTHLSCAVRPRLGQGVLQCPCHEGYFDLTSGRPISGPPRRPLPRVRVERVGNELYATGVEGRTV